MIGPTGPTGATGATGTTGEIGPTGPAAEDAGCCVLTFRPASGLTGPVVFDDFNALYAQFDSMRSAAQNSGKFLIVFDDQDIGGPGNIVVLDSGPGDITYDFLYATLVGVHEDVNTLLDIKDGGGETDSLTIINALWFEGLTIRATGQDTAFDTSNNQTFTLTRTTFLGGGGQYVMDFLAVTGCILHLNDESTIERNGVFPAGVAAVRINNSLVTVHMNGANSRVNANAFITGGGAQLTPIINSSSARFDFDQADVGGVVNAQMSTAAGYWTYGAPFTVTDPNGVLAATRSTLIVDEATGFIWRNTDGATAWERFSANPSSPPEQWAVQNVPANTPATAMSAQVSTNFDDIKMMRPGSIVGISSRLTEAVTAGTVQVDATINGVIVPAAALNVTMGVASTGGQTLAAPGVAPYVAGDLIGIKFTTSAGFTPTTTDLEAWLEILEDLP